MRVGGWVHNWVDYESASPDHDGHPLDFEYDPTHDYIPGPTIEAGMHPEELALCDATTIDDISKTYFFHIIATIEKLGACKAKKVEAKLSSVEASALWRVMLSFLCLRSDLVLKWGNQPNHPQKTASRKIADAAERCESLRLTRNEVSQVLLNCQVVSGPKPRGHPQDPNLHPKKANTNRKRRGKSSQVDSPESIRARGVESDRNLADACLTSESSSLPAKDVPSQEVPIIQGQHILPIQVDEKSESITAQEHGLMSDVDGNVAATKDYEEMQVSTAPTPEYIIEEVVPTCANEITEHDSTLPEDHFRRENSKNVYDSVLGSEVGHTGSMISELSYHSTEKITSRSFQDIEEVSNKVLSLVAKLQPENEVSPRHHTISTLQHLLEGMRQNAENLHEQVKAINSNAERIMALVQESHERDLEEEKAGCAMRIEENERSLEKKLSDVKDKAAEDLRSERRASAKLKQPLNQKNLGLRETAADR
ncbi:hypothetical protein IFR04_002386 [Cadophora malorum]|uniref:Uncharacterized protein n=1 Tax=Cadophora malorum TaxID=108018 RepID=A0A8H8BUV4_9HELO|nr:hypothetical protein IFR04_002386 [Cadophora malorum]